APRPDGTMGNPTGISIRTVSSPASPLGPLYAQNAFGFGERIPRPEFDELVQGVLGLQMQVSRDKTRWNSLVDQIIAKAQNAATKGQITQGEVDRLREVMERWKGQRPTTQEIDREFQYLAHLPPPSPSSHENG